MSAKILNESQWSGEILDFINYQDKKIRAR